jgi:uncharacterized protein YndB with AHSA1/START domain
VIKFETRLLVKHPIEDVFAYVADPGNFPHWNSAVQAVRTTSASGDNELGSTYLMERNLHSRRAVNELEIVSRERPSEFAIRTTSGPTPFAYHFRFTSAAGATLIQVDAEADLGGAADLLAPLVRRAVQKGVDENLATLKTILETGGERH